MFATKKLPVLLFCSAIGAVSPVLADPIGSATRINPSVTGTASGRASAIAVGDDVVQNETVQTGPAGEAKLRFIDSTDLSVGPGSNIKLDKFVFAGGGTASSVVMSTSRGAFRFTTGNSAHEAYQINTPAAAIGVRGTQFSFTVRNGRLNLDVLQGVVIVCPRGKGKSSCVEARPGQSVQAQAGSPAQVFAAGGPPPDDPQPPPRRAQRPPRGGEPEPPPDGGPGPLGALPQLGLQIGIPLLLGGGGRGGRFPDGGRAPTGGRNPCQYGNCLR